MSGQKLTSLSCPNTCTETIVFGSGIGHETHLSSYMSCYNHINWGISCQAFLFENCMQWSHQLRALWLKYHFHTWHKTIDYRTVTCCNWTNQLTSANRDQVVGTPGLLALWSQFWAKEKRRGGTALWKHGSAELCHAVRVYLAVSSPQECRSIRLTFG